MKMRITCLLLLVIAILTLPHHSPESCQFPQKGIYLSYNALAKADTITHLFQHLTAKLPTSSDSFTDQSTATNFTISNMHAILKYNEHYQKQTYQDSQHTKVQLGQLALEYEMRYQVSRNNGSVTTGTCYGRVTFDEASFSKELLIIEGYLEWDPTLISPLHISFPLSIDSSQPKLNHSDQTNLQLLLNDHEGSSKIKTNLLQVINEQYSLLLKEHLNNEQVISTNNITYSYNGKNYSYYNVVKNYTLENNRTKGLEVFFFFGQDGTQGPCLQRDRIQFSYRDFGGIQEVYAIPAMQQMFETAVKKGLFSAKIDRMWEVRTFQFYMGDLANIIPHAKSFIPDSVFYGSCQWNHEDPNPSILKPFSQNELYSQVPIQCRFTHNSDNFLNLKFTLFLVIKVLPQLNTLSFIIKNSDAIGIKVETVDPSFVVRDQNLLKFYVKEVVKGLHGQEVLGTGWKTLSKKFPAVYFPNSQYMVLYDPSSV